MDKPLTGRIALVTGSGRGLGHAIAERLAELGADIAIHDITQDAPAEFGEASDLNAVATKIAGHGVRTVAVTGDIGNPSQIRDMVQTVEKTLGPIGILVNCAGGDIAAKGGKPVPNNALGIPPEDIRAIMDRNIIGTMFVCQAVCPGMAERGSGAVVNIASVAGHMGVTEGVAYAVAKAGIVEFTRCLAKDLRPHGVRVNTISPGPAMTARFFATRTTDPKMSDPSVPLMRYALPAEIADAVAFFAGDGARFVSGQVICVDGGSLLFPT
jgi:3-oxoacyl-[acyl-carrier protein] reductase